MVTSKPPSTMPPFAARLCAWRAAFACGPVELARRVGLSRTTVQNWLAGESYPTPDHLPALAQVTHISEKEWAAVIRASQVPTRRASPGWSEHPRQRGRRGNSPPPVHTIADVAPRGRASLQARLDETLPPELAERIKATLAAEP